MFSIIKTIKERDPAARNTFEIILTSGIPRHALFCGKIIFIFCISSILGLLSMGLAMIWSRMSLSIMLIGVKDLALFFTALFLNTSSAAFLSIYMPNPRISHFINLLLVSILYGFLFFFTTSMLIIIPTLLSLSVIIFSFALRGFNSERIVRPITL